MSVGTLGDTGGVFHTRSRFLGFTRSVASAGRQAMTSETERNEPQSSDVAQVAAWALSPQRCRRACFLALRRCAAMGKLINRSRYALHLRYSKITSLCAGACRSTGSTDKKRTGRPPSPLNLMPVTKEECQIHSGVFNIWELERL